MKSAGHGERAVADWMSQHSAAVGWRRLSGQYAGEFELGHGSSHSAFLLVADGEWQLQLDTEKGRSLPVLGPVDSPLEVLLDALMFAIYMRATAEVDRADRTASAQLSLLLQQFAAVTDDARYGGRASLLLARHALKDGRQRKARSLIEDAIRLFGDARDLTAEESARTLLADLPRLMSRQGL